VAYPRTYGISLIVSLIQKGGVAFMKSPVGRAFYSFFGENVFRADLSCSVPELGSLLEHSEVNIDNTIVYLLGCWKIRNRGSESIWSRYCHILCLLLKL
jgi:hypothetical protein